MAFSPAAKERLARAFSRGKQIDATSLRGSADASEEKIHRKVDSVFGQTLLERIFGLD
jgi:hypothetical protein